MDHQILIDAEVAVPQGLEEGLRRVITAALAAEGVALPCEISVLLTDDAGIRQINADMRDIDRATDVLSFPMFELTPGEPPEDEEDLDPETGLCPLGDMCIPDFPERRHFPPPFSPCPALRRSFPCAL